MHTNAIINPRSTLSASFSATHTKITSIFQDNMSQAVAPDLEPSPDLPTPPSDPPSPPADPPHKDADPCRDALVTSASASPPESPVSHEPTRETVTADACAGGAGDAEAPAELQAIECDQPVSLEPDNTEEEEVCWRR